MIDSYNVIERIRNLKFPKTMSGKIFHKKNTFLYTISQKNVEYDQKFCVIPSLECVTISSNNFYRIRGMIKKCKNKNLDIRDTPYYRRYILLHIISGTIP